MPPSFGSSTPVHVCVTPHPGLPTQSKEAEPLGQYDGWKRGWEMLDDPSQYDLVMRTRADMEYEIPLAFGRIVEQFAPAAAAWGGNFLLLPCRR